ncbi:MAG: hypothetical protein PUF16_04495 [Lachnospiraceae bacterium]|nr:hypothetical protein [Lachnospiraceae bacterium]
MGLFGHRRKYTVMYVDIAGFSKKCKYKTEKYYWRQDALEDSKEGDSVSIKKFSYQKQPAYAIINNRIGVDIGVIPAKDIPEFEKRFPDLADIEGSIDLLQKETSAKSDEVFIDGSIKMEKWSEPK